jgi:hypothetical protein
MQIVNEKISLAELKAMSEKMFGGLVKAVVDIEKEIMVIGAFMHADAERLLLDQSSEQEHLWGINIYPEKVDTLRWIEFDSIINLRPPHVNKSISIEDPKICEQITKIVNSLVLK